MISFSEIFSLNDSLINIYYASVQEGVSFDSLANIYTERPGKKETSGFYELQDVEFSDFSKEANKLENAGDYSEPVSFSGGYSIFKLNERQPAGLKTFEEAKAEVSGEYQEMESKRLEDEYINSSISYLEGLGKKRLLDLSSSDRQTLSNYHSIIRRLNGE